MMSRLPLAALLLALPVIAATTLPRAARAQVVVPRGTPDSVAIDAGVARARRHATDGDLAGARLVLDSLAVVAEQGSRRLAEVLFWRATYAQTAAGAERDYRRIVIEHPLSPRTEDALLRLAQLELARGDQQMAVRHLERLVLEHPESPNRARARYWTARAWMDAGEVAKGCAALGDALVSAGGTDAELRTQVRYAGQRCPKGWDASAGAATAAVAGKQPVPLTVVETTTVARADSLPAAASVEPPRQGIAGASRESVTTPPPAASTARPTTPAAMPPYLGASAPSSSAPASTTTSSSSSSSRADSTAGRGAPPNTNIAPPAQQAVTTNARPASTGRPAIVVPPLARTPKGVGGSAVAGTVVGGPASTPASTPAGTSPSTAADAPPKPPAAATRAPVTTASTPANIPASVPASAPATTPARSGAGAAPAARRNVFSVQLAAYDTRADAESLVRRLTGRGIDARVSGDAAPFRVRVGRYATRAEAVRQLATLKAKGHDGWVAEEAAPAAGGNAQ